MKKRIYTPKNAVLNGFFIFSATLKILKLFVKYVFKRAETYL